MKLKRILEELILEAPPAAPGTPPPASDPGAENLGGDSTQGGGSNPMTMGANDPDSMFKPEGSDDMSSGDGEEEDKDESNDQDAITKQVETKLMKMIEAAAKKFNEEVLKNEQRLPIFLAKVEKIGLIDTLKNYLKTMYIKDSIKEPNERLFAHATIDKFAKMLSEKILGTLLFKDKPSKDKKINKINTKNLKTIEDEKEE